MFTRLIHLLMCLTVLVCPAMCGACCGTGNESVVTVGGCENHCCCHVQHEQAPVAPECPGPCHDCFCAGALAPGFNASVELVGMADMPAVAPIENLAATTPQRLAFAFRDESPPHGRTLLTFYCRFLL